MSTKIPKVSGGENVRAVDRALDILSAFRADDHGLTVAELQQRRDLSRPTLYRLLGTLEQRGFLSSAGEPLRFRLGPAVAQLSNAWRASLDVAVVAQPMLRELWRQSRETVALYLREDPYRICVAEIESPQPRWAWTN